jgi:hypothetical protein
MEPEQKPKKSSSATSLPLTEWPIELQKAIIKALQSQRLRRIETVKLSDEWRNRL